MLPNRLRPGDTIGLVSPSHVATRERYGPIIQVLESRGFRIKEGENLYKSTYGYSATERERADDFNAMIRDDAVKMVLFGGGEGGNELLPYLDFDGVKAHPKLLCSYSDGTTILNAVHAQTGLIVYYGQAPGTFEDLRYYDYAQFSAHFLAGPAAGLAPNSRWICVRPGVCKGLLIGGYTRNFALLLGSKYFSYRGEERYVLFLEDHEKFSDVAAVSAYLSHIEQSPFMDRVAGLLFGHYSTSIHPELMQRLERFGAGRNLPVAYCDDFGHGVNHGILPIGCTATLDAGKGTLRFEYPGR